jgi:hypothetical protein
MTIPAPPTSASPEGRQRIRTAELEYRLGLNMEGNITDNSIFWNNPLF